MDTSFLLPGEVELSNLDRINFIIGKNGSGKSTMLKEIEGAIAAKHGRDYCKYVSPERGGALQYDPNVEGNVVSGGTWMIDTRRNNQVTNFRQQTVVIYRQLERSLLLAIDDDRTIKDGPKSIIAEINTLLDNIQLRLGGKMSFEMVSKKTDEVIPADKISSGESELIALAVECISFEHNRRKVGGGWLLLDEPDVHLHPDLQARLARLLLKLTADGKIHIIVVTHSTAFIGAMSETPHSRVAFLHGAKRSLTFRSITEGLKDIIPVFGAHPLSNIFNENRLLIVEGEDDVRIWQRACRSSQGKVNVYPVAAGSKDKLINLEKEAAEIIESVYENAKAFSLRDRDDGPSEDIAPVGPVQRFRLRCRTAENLMLSNDVLKTLKVDWETMIGLVERWLEKNTNHPNYVAMLSFAKSKYDRRNFDLKEIRNDLLSMMGSSKSWEDAVGIAIASAKRGPVAPDSIHDYLGAGVCSNLLQP